MEYARERALGRNTRRHSRQERGFMDTLTCAKDVYSGYQYKNRWAIDVFWRRANTLEACIRFVAAAHNRWPDDPDVQRMVDDLIERLYIGPTTEDQFFESWLDDDRVWADDFFWCGAASLSAYDFLLGRYPPVIPAGKKRRGISQSRRRAGCARLALATTWRRRLRRFHTAAETAPFQRTTR
jgi:hypothetical protein